VAAAVVVEQRNYIPFIAAILLLAEADSAALPLCPPFASLIFAGATQDAAETSAASASAIRTRYVMGTPPLATAITTIAPAGDSNRDAARVVGFV
jgi:hypothetical protein